MLSGVHAAGAVLGRDLNTEIQNSAVFGDASRLEPLGPDWDPLAIACAGNQAAIEDDADLVTLTSNS